MSNRPNNVEKGPAGIMEARHTERSRSVAAVGYQAVE